MICIVKLKAHNPNDPAMTSPVDDIETYIIAFDLPDARRQAHCQGHSALANRLYQMELKPAVGKYGLPDGYMMLVS